MKKSVLLLLALWLCNLTLMAITVSQQRSSQMALFEAQIGVSTPVVKFTATNKPATVADLKAAIGTEPVASGDAVELNSLVTMTAAEAPNYHVDWYVNGKKANAVGYSFTQHLRGDTLREVCRCERYHLYGSELLLP